MSNYKTYKITIIAKTDIICSPRESNQKINGIDWDVEGNKIKYRNSGREIKTEDTQIDIIYPTYHNLINYYLPGTTIKGNLRKKEIKDIMISDFKLLDESKVKVKKIKKVMNLYRNVEDFEYYIKNKKKIKKIYLFFNKKTKIKINNKEIEIKNGKNYYSQVWGENDELKIEKNGDFIKETININKQPKKIKHDYFFEKIGFEVYTKGSVFEGFIKIKDENQKLTIESKEFDYKYTLTQEEKTRNTFKIPPSYGKDDKDINLIIGGFRGNKNAKIKPQESTKSAIYTLDNDIIGAIQLKIEEVKNGKR